MNKKQDDENQRFIQPSKAGFLARIRNNFLTGIVVAAPIGITIWLIYLLISGPLADLDGFVKRVLPDQFTPTSELEFLPGFGVLVAILALILLGGLAKNFIGRSLLKSGEQLFNSMPVVRNLYGFFKNVFEMALQQSDRSFKEVALIEYPREGLWALCFVITETKGELAHRLADRGEDLTSVFIPTTPNPTSGFLIYVPRSELRIMDMTVEDGAKLIFSMGLVTPAYSSDEMVQKLEEVAEETKQRKPIMSFLRKNSSHED
ncbi:MAG: DUF502 domain-containing protein [bacterium]